MMRLDARGIVLGLPAVVVAVLLVVASCKPDYSTRLPSIVMIYVDDLGWRDLGVQGSTYYETPNIDRLASQGVRFTSAYANAPNCAPSRAALMSGMYAPRTGVYTVASAARGQASLRKLVPVENKTTLDLDVVTLPEALKTAGYTTGHVGKWHLGGEGFLPSDQGFDWSRAGDHTGTPRSYFYPYVGRDGTVIPGLERGQEGEYLPDRLTDEAIQFVNANAERPFFLYLSHYSVHTPIRAKPDVVAKYEAKAPSGGHGNPTYAAMVESVDDSVGRLMLALDSLGIADNTIVIFYADNGGYGPATSMAPLRGSKGMLYEGGIREPLIVRWPGKAAAGRTVDVPVIGTDIYPTLLEVSRAEVPAGVTLDGNSIVSLLSDEPADPASMSQIIDRPLFWHFPAYLERYRTDPGPWRTTPASAVRLGDYKLLHFFEGDSWELYNLDADAGESRDLAEAEPAKLRELRAILEAWWAETGAFLPAELNEEYDPPDSNSILRPHAAE